MSKNQTIGYVRGSSDKQTIKTQRHEILEYCQKKKIQVDDLINVEMSSRRTPK